jgi:hypothetical protein
MKEESPRFLIIHQINIAVVLTIVIAAMVTALPAALSRIAYAQTIINLNPLETFSAKGLIGSLIFNTEGATEGSRSSSNSSDINKTNANITNANITNAVLTNKNSNPYILVGNWGLNVTNKKITYFDINFTMVHASGTDRHTHELTNFKRISIIPILLDPNGITFIGMMDIKQNGNDKWFGVPVTASVGKQFNTISIKTNPDYTNNHFMRQPIFGVFTSLKDQSGTELIITKPVA